MTRRPGMTMTELLVAIFVVAIGLAGVMSMVPFGAKQMSDALVADRCNTLATTIDGTVRGYWTDKIAGVVATGGNPTDDFWTALDNPGGGRGLAAPGPTEPSYPVFLDPFGVLGKTGSERDWVGFNGGTNVPRRNMNLVGNNNLLAQRMWSQPDGFTWDEAQDGATPTTATTRRELRYSALAVIQRPTNSARLTATLKVVTFSNRPFAFNPPGAEVVVSNVAFVPGQTTLQVPIATLTAANVDLKKGNWVMDATVNPAVASTNTPAIRHANFYRVVSATENTPGTYDVELAAPIRRTDGRNDPARDGYTGTLVVMPGVSAVYEFPALTGSTAP